MTHPVLIALIAISAGLAVANIYYAQPLIEIIASELQPATLDLPGSSSRSLSRLRRGAAARGPARAIDSRIASWSWRRWRVSWSVCSASRFPTRLMTFLIASFIVGISAVATQILVPFASYLASAEERGRVVGIVMGGLLGGIMLARPFSSSIAGWLGWRAVFYVSAALMIVLILVLMRALPQRRPPPGLTYWHIMGSLPGLVASTPVLRRRAFYQGMLFAAFNVFWTSIPCCSPTSSDLASTALRCSRLRARRVPSLRPWRAGLPIEASPNLLRASRWL